VWRRTSLASLTRESTGWVRSTGPAAPPTTRDPDASSGALRDRQRQGAPRRLRVLAPGEATDADYPFVLITGRRLEHYNAGTMTRLTSNLDLLPEERLEINPVDAPGSACPMPTASR